MLKVKDNVDLKELENYGLFIFYGNYRKHGHFKVAKNRHIIPLNGGGCERFDIIYKLIKADMIEEVEEK